jgi:mannose-1-phosphate guanylyltransferase/mannose-1-phosphate guanylyltransferase/phosphomannomutase
MREAHEGHDGIATLATKRVDDTSEFGVAITGDDGRIQGFQEKPDPAEALSDLANCGIYMFRREIFDYFPEPGHRSPAGGDEQPEGFVDWAMDVFPALLSSDVPFYSHEIEAYWDDIGSLSEYVQGNFDALAGEVGLEEVGGEIRDGVLHGREIELGEGAAVRAPAVLGDGCRIGAGATVREAIVLPGAELADGEELAAGSVLVGGEYGVAGG